MGPYHIARSRAAALQLKKDGIQTVVVQLAGEEETRDWQGSAEKVPYELVTLRPDAVLSEERPTIFNQASEFLEEIGLSSQSTRMTGQLRELLDRLQPSFVAVAGYDRPEMRGTLRWAQENGAVGVLMSESKWDDRPRPWWKQWVISHFVSLADAALVSGAAAGEFINAMGMARESIFRHYGAVNNSFFREASQVAETDKPRPSYLPTDPYFLSCARLIESRKNMRRLLEAYNVYRAYVNSSSPWRLIICGDGEDRDMMEAYTSTNRIGGVSFEGFQQAERLADYYAYANCFIHTAIREPWGLVVNEAASAGLPLLISRRCGSAYDLVHERINGLTFNPYDVEEIAGHMSYIHHLSDDERSKMGRHSQEIVQRFGPKRFACGLTAAFTSSQRSDTD